MKLIFKSILTLMAVIITITQSIYAQKNTDNVIIEKQFSKVERIDISSMFNVRIISGDQNSIKIDSPREYKDKIRLDVEGGILKLTMRQANNIKGKINVEIVCNGFNSILVSGMADVVIDSKFSFNDLNISVSSMGKLVFKHGINVRQSLLKVNADSMGEFRSEEQSKVKDKCIIDASGMGKVRLNIDVPELKLACSAMAEMVILGKTERLDVSATGMAKVNCRKLEFTTLIMKSNSMAKVSIDPSKAKIE